MELPEAYRIGWVPFGHVKIWLDSHPLIPRTETEYWTMHAIEEFKTNGFKKILDLCAGSGAIGVAVLKEIPEVEVDFAEVEVRHHLTIKKNIEENIPEGKGRSNIFAGDLFENIQGTYDAILSNPPYIDSEKISRVEESVIKYEPREALLGGKGGMKIIRRIIEEAPKYLNPGGIIYIEHEPEQVEYIKNLTDRFNFDCETLCDQYGVLRFSHLIKK